MEESQEILLNSLANSGVTIPPGISSIQDLTPATLVSICAQSLRLIGVTSPFLTSLPDSMADQFRICNELASAVKDLGFIGDMSFHKFLYPSEEDLYKLVRFLVERLSEVGETAGKWDINASAIIKDDSNNWTSKVDNQALDLNEQEVRTGLQELRLKNKVPESSNSKKSEPRMIDSSRKEVISMEIGQRSKEFWDSRTDASLNEEIAVQTEDENVSELGQKLILLKEQSSKIKHKIENLRSQEKMVTEEVTAKTLELQHLEEECELLKVAAEMAFNDQHDSDIYITKLNEKIEAKRHNLVELELQWHTLRKPLEEKKRSLEEALYATKPDSQEELQKFKEIELEIQSVLSDTKKREEEHSKLSADFERQPKSASRRSYIERITEITKNSRKQDADIERILKETRELQLESNSIQGRLHRTYAVVDETVFREAKKDPVARQAYRLLTSIHQSFELISEKILATDRTRREVAEHEAILVSFASQSLNIDKLQADLDAIKKENELLEQRLHGT